MPSAKKSHGLKRGFDYIGVTCAFFCHNGKGKILMHKRSQDCRDEKGTWDVGGGSMEFGETFEECVRREVMEEYGAEPVEIQYIGTKNVLREHSGKKTHWVKNLHRVLIDPRKVKNGDPEKIDEIGWFDIDNPPSPLHSQFLDEVEMIREFFKEKEPA